DHDAVSEYAVARTSPDGEFMLAGELNASRASIVHLASGRIVAQTPAARDRLAALAFSPSGEAFAVGCLNGIVTCYDLEREGDTFRVSRRTTLHAHQSSVVSLQFIARGRLATCGADGLVKVWDLSRAERRMKLPVPRLKDFCLSPD